MKLGFIGAGNMAGAIIKGFVNKNCVNSSDIYFIRQNKEKQAQQASELGINGCNDYESLIENSDIPVSYTHLQLHHKHHLLHL